MKGVKYIIKGGPMNSKVIMYDSPEAASIQSVTGWVSSCGHFWGANEDQARWSGSTHKKCNNNAEHEIFSKHSYCYECHIEKRQAKFESLEIVEWDGKTPLNLFYTDFYFFDAEQVYEYCADHGVSAESLQLVLCVPINMGEVEADYWCDAFAEEVLLPPEVEAALSDLNEAIQKYGKSVSWSPDNKRVILSGEVDYGDE